MRITLIIAMALTFAIALTGCDFLKRLFGFGEKERGNTSKSFSIEFEAPKDATPDTGQLFLVSHPDTFPDTGQLFVTTYPDTLAVEAELLLKLKPDTLPDSGIFKMTMPPGGQQYTGTFLMKFNPGAFPDTALFKMTLQPGGVPITGMIASTAFIDTFQDTSHLELTYRPMVSAPTGSVIVPTPGEVTVTNPVGEETFAHGQTVEIRWTSEGAGTTVKIELFKGESLHCVIEPSVENNGSYIWHVGECRGESGSDYQVRITDLGT